MKFRLIALIFLIPLIVNAAEEGAEAIGWKGEGELGFTSTSGNSDSETLIANLGVSNEVDLWKHSALLKLLQAETDDVESANSIKFTARSEYKISSASYLFGQFRYEDDEFSGFDYRTSVAVGVGSRVIETEKQFLDLSIGLGFRSSKESETGDTEDDAIALAGLVYQRHISESAIFSQSLSIEDGEENTHSESETALKLKVDGNLSAKLAYQINRNSEVPAGTDKSDEITSVSLVYGF